MCVYGHRVIFVVIVLLALAAIFTTPYWMPRPVYRALHYPGGRPNAYARLNMSAMAWLGSRGIAPGALVTLETTGRRSGNPSRVPLVMAQIGGERYLVSMLGERVVWVRNLRAANGRAVLRHGVVEDVRTEEVAADARAPILQAFLKRAPGARPHFDLNMNAPLEEFNKVASRYPVFRILPPAPGAPA